MDALAQQDSTAIGEAIGAYMTAKSGPFATGGNFAGGILPVVEFLEESEDDLEVLLKRHGTRDEAQTPFSKSHAEFTGSGDIIGEKTASASSDNEDGADSPEKYLTIASIACMLLHPLSRGKTPISSSNPEIRPQIDLKYLSRSRNSRNSLSPRPLHFQRYSPLLFPHFSNLPEGEITVHLTIFTNLDAVEEYGKKAALSAWHPTSTYAMKPLDKGGVTTVYAVTEKAADLIREDHGIKV
ncbi:hypothetical protein BHYA_0285g00080 [Botrytis hyacinthi]|uniref:Uncharacterized protein n=1 Tax=Botrytis hyacinthi TaxID=278943 RepID=A0A4Z1GCM0_9HELO|nr:hypothetical protein BHYA_0285g00080 [Botrytis hyacinthi]